MSKVHIGSTPKGGSGKTFTTSLLSQVLSAAHDNVLILDLDQENPTLSQYAALNVHKISVMGDNREIDSKKFDTLLALILEHEGDVIIDVGSNSFTPLLSYALESSMFDTIEAGGKGVILHSIICGGSGLKDTTSGFANVAELTSSPIVLWLNEHFGALESTDGVKIEDAKIIQKYADRIIGTIKLQKRNPVTFGSDIDKMSKMRLTFDEVDASDAFMIAEKVRLRMIRKAVFDQLEALAL
jgi:hypothetical protein